jgi:hypothetical protein
VEVVFCFGAVPLTVISIPCTEDEVTLVSLLQNMSHLSITVLYMMGWIYLYNEFNLHGVRSMFHINIVCYNQSESYEN